MCVIGIRCPSPNPMTWGCWGNQQHKLPTIPIEALKLYESGTISVQHWSWVVKKTLKSDKEGTKEVKESVLAAITRWWLSHPFEQKIIKFIRSSPSFEVAIGELFHHRVIMFSRFFNCCFYRDCVKQFNMKVCVCPSGEGNFHFPKL